MEEHFVKRLRKARSYAKAQLTRKINKIKELTNDHENLTAVKDLLSELHDTMKIFKTTHEAYHYQLKSEDELRKSNDYRASVEAKTTHFEQEIDSWLTQIGKDIEKSLRRQSDQNLASVEPDDSISNVGSSTSYHTRSWVGSVRSATSAGAKAAARKAALEAEAEILERLHQLEVDELMLQQRRKQLELRGAIAAAEAEKEVYERAESEVSSRTRQEEIEHCRHGEEVTPQDKTYRVEHSPPDSKPKASSMSTPIHTNYPLDNSHDESFRKLVEVQDQQSNALQQLIQQQQQGVNALTLPQPSMQIFSGDPIDYCDFIRSFEHLIEAKTTSSSARLYYLIQHTSGSAQELMKSCLSMNEDEGYAEARRLLKERFGQNYRVAAAHVQRLVNGPPIRNEDGTALQQFSVQLTSCTNTLEKIGYLERLNNSDNLKKIVERLPYAMRIKWRDTVDRIIERESRDITVKDINNFVTAKARATTHPIFGKISTTEKPKVPISRVKRHGAAAGFSSQGTPQTLECPLCQSNHWLSRCEKFRKQSLEERQKLVKEKKLCHNCLATGHYVRSCTKKSFCKVQGCSGTHSTFLHPKSGNGKPETDWKLKENKAKEKEVSTTQNAQDKVNTASNAYIKSKVPKSNSTTGLAIVPVKVKGMGNSNTVETYAFLDSGSNTTFCTDALLKRLGIQGERTNLSLTTMQSENTVVACSLVSLEVSDLEKNCEIKLPFVYSRPSLPVPVEAIGTQQDVDRWPYLQGIKIPHIDEDVGLLIGSNIPEALQPREIKESQNGGPFATRTALGWVLNGPLERKTTKVLTANFVQADHKLEQQFADYCNREFDVGKYDDKPAMSRNDRKAMEIMERSATLENGHYVIALPWKTYPPSLPNNRVQAQSRLQLLKKRLTKDSSLYEKYKDFMDSLFTNNYASKVTNHTNGPLGTQWYLPHHPVFHPQKPGKVRVVFDCSAKYGNSSLNDQLLQGPDLTNTLVGVLTRFREEPVAFISDIEAMFYQVRVQPSDCDALRFLWWPDGDMNSPPEEYQMNVHLFGGASSPSCANFALKKTATDNETLFDSQTIETVRRNFYVDDCLKSVGSEDEAIKLAKNLRELLALGGFNLTKWLSNSKKVIMSIPESQRSAQVKDMDFAQPSIERALGVQWNVSSDKFGFAVVIKDRPATRRGILSIISSVYDPLGFVAPFILTAKLILQDLCRLKLNWDDKIPEEFIRRWRAWLNDLPNLEQLAIDRCFKPFPVEEVDSIQLHHFSDASQQGYGAVTYLRTTNNSGEVKCSFVMGKSRLAPIKAVTIPRMELSAAVLSTKLEKMAKNELTLPVNQSFFWTDSTCVLRYLANTEKRFQTFVANRIASIHDASSPSQWSYVDTNSNPADEASRGVPVNSLQRWLNGPDFLRKSPDAWPRTPEELGQNVPDSDPEIKKSSAVSASIMSNTRNGWEEVFERFSSWYRLKRVVAWILRFITNIRRRVAHRQQNQSTKFPDTNPIPPISLDEMTQAETHILKRIQENHFYDELRQLKGSPRNNKTDRESGEVSKSSSLVKLNPIFTEGLIRVGGRLQHAPIDTNARHPVILPKNHHVVNLLIRFYHHLSGHSGLEYTLSTIRQRYWILRARSTLKKILNGCVSCRKRQASVLEQKMASLPEDRITPSKPPFSFTGVDCFGPFQVRRGRTTAKRYGVIFTCLTLRAIHIEVASSLDTDSFINALRRFIARRGQPEEMRSDNGGNFVRGERELREEIENWNQSRIHDFLVQRNVKWTFNPPAASHHGGVWERCIRTVRKVARAIAKEQILDDEGLCTLMCEVESIVNGRPLTKLSDDPNDMEPLTPNHLLLLRSNPKVPPGVFSKDDNCENKRWRQVQYLANVFWRRWTREYLPSLQQRQKWTRERRNLMVNDIVLILDEKTPRSSWPLGRVLEVHVNRKDGLVRSAKVKTSTTVLVRPLSKIIFLESMETPMNDK